MSNTFTGIANRASVAFEHAVNYFSNSRAKNVKDDGRAGLMQGLQVNHAEVPVAPAQKGTFGAAVKKVFLTLKSFVFGTTGKDSAASNPMTNKPQEEVDAWLRANCCSQRSNMGAERTEKPLEQENYPYTDKGNKTVHVSKGKSVDVKIARERLLAAKARFESNMPNDGPGGSSIADKRNSPRDAMYLPGFSYEAMVAEVESGTKG